MEPITDWLGQKIHVGSLVVYPTRHSSSMTLVLGRVEALDEIVPKGYDSNGLPVRAAVLHSQRHTPPHKQRHVYYPYKSARHHSGGHRLVPDPSKAAVLTVQRLKDTAGYKAVGQNVKVENLDRVTVIDGAVLGEPV